jgi:two-component system NarL family sensor kinase
VSNPRSKAPPAESRRAQRRAAGSFPDPSSKLDLAQTFIDQSDDWIAWIDSDGRLPIVNPAFRRALGYSRTELSALRAWDLSPISGGSWPAAWSEMKQRGSRTFRAELRTRTGALVSAEFRVKFVSLDGNEYLLCCGREHESPSSFDQFQQRFSVLLEHGLEHAGHAIFLLDQGRVVDSSRKARELSDGLETLLESAALRKLTERALAGEDLTFHWQGQRPNGTRFDIEWTLCRIDVQGHVRLLAVAVDVTARRRAAQRLAQLSGRLLQLQDEERRRIARELHDTTGQNLGALSINLSMVIAGASRLDPRARETLQECLTLADTSIREIRTMSYLLHPPLLDELGLESALRSYVGGYSERTGIRVDLDLPPGIGRLPQEIEVALFRIVQEGLSNVHRHSGSRTAALRLARNPDHVELELADSGVGLHSGSLEWNMTSPSRIGVGIAGMRERARQLGGRLTIASSEAGTTLHVVLPTWHAKRPNLA